MKDITKTKEDVGLDRQSSNNLVIKLPENRDGMATSLMTLKQDIRSTLGSNSRARILDYKEIKETLQFAVSVILFLFWIIAGLLYVMIFYQVILVVESLLRQSEQ